MTQTATPAQQLEFLTTESRKALAIFARLPLPEYFKRNEEGDILALAIEQASDHIASALNILSAHPIGKEAQGDTEDQMVRIEKLIEDMQSIKHRFGNTCVYIRRGGLSWGAVALNRRDDDKKHGIFDLQAQHDRDMLTRLEQIERLKSSHNSAEQEVGRLKVELASAKLQITGLEHTISGQRQALEAVWEDWTIANDASGMDHYEIKDVAPETVAVVQVTLRVPRMASSIASGSLSDDEMKAQALRCGCRGHDDYCVCQNTPDHTTIRERITKAESAADALTLADNNSPNG